MKCNECGRELIKLGFHLTDVEEADLGLAMDKTRAAETALRPDVVNSYKFEDDKMLYAYFKAAFDELAEGRFLYALWEKGVRKAHDYPEGEIFAIGGECYKHGE